MLSKAISIVAQAFEGKKDKGGKPYILHCLRVMNEVNQDDEELMQIAVMHDLLEDCSDKYSLHDLAAMGFSPRVCRTVATLTHTKDVPYDDYIKMISLNKDARIVKLADLKDNSQIHRLKGLTKKDFDRMEKYHRSFVYLSKV